MVSFVSVPSITASDLPPDVKIFLIAVKDNVEILTGQKTGLTDGTAVVLGQVTIQELSTLTKGRVRATGQSFAISDVKVASGEDHATLVGDVQSVAYDVEKLTTAFNALVRQLKGQ